MRLHVCISTRMHAPYSFSFVCSKERKKSRPYSFLKTIIHYILETASFIAVKGENASKPIIHLDPFITQSSFTYDVKSVAERK